MCLNCSYAHIHCFTTWLQIGTVRCLGQMRQGQSSPIYFIFTLHHPIPNRQHIDRQVIKAAVLTASSQYLSLWSQSGLNQASDGLAVWEGWSQPHNKHCDFGPAFDETAPRCPFHQTKPQSVCLLFFLCLGILIPPLISLSQCAACPCLYCWNAYCCRICLFRFRSSSTGCGRTMMKCYYGNRKNCRKYNPK